MAKYAKVLIRRDSTLNWYAANPKLELGEIGVDMNLLRLKVGNGIDKWRELPYINDDLYKTHDKDKQAILDKISDILEEIEANRVTAERKINSVDSKVTVLETRQSIYERELTADLQEALDKLDEGLADFATTKNELTTRMDVIVGSATEDTEILDARVDAEYNVHPNLGHNIRAIHEKLLKTSTQSEQSASDIEYLKGQVKSQAEDFENVTQALQEQININSQGIAENSLAVHDEAETRRKRVSELEKSIQSEKQQRISEDNFLQFEIDRLTDDLISEEEQREIQDKNLAQQSSILEDEIKNRMQDSEGLAKQANENAEANALNTLLIHDFKEKAKEDLSREFSERVENDEALQHQVNINSEGIAENSFAIHDLIKRQKEKSTRDFIEHITNDEALQEQVNLNTEGISQNTLLINDLSKKQSENLSREAASRINQDEALQEQINLNADSISETLYTLHYEAEQRRALADKLIAEIRTRENEISTLLKQLASLSSLSALPDTDNLKELQYQINQNTEGIAENTFAVHGEAEQRRNAIKAEHDERVENDEALQKQINLNAEANNHVIDFVSYLNKKHTLRDNFTYNSAYEQGIALQSQIDNLSEAINENMLNTYQDLRDIKGLIKELIIVTPDEDEFISDEDFARVFDDLFNSTYTDELIDQMFNP